MNYPMVNEVVHGCDIEIWVFVLVIDIEAGQLFVLWI